VGGGWWVHGSSFSQVRSLGGRDACFGAGARLKLRAAAGNHGADEIQIRLVLASMSRIERTIAQDS
jgi:hypothetical protein